MNKLLILIMIFSVSIMAIAEEDDRKMTPEEKRAYEEAPALRLLLPDAVALPNLANIMIMRGDNQCYNEFRLMVSALYDACDYIFRTGPTTGAEVLRLVNVGPILIDGTTAMIRNMAGNRIAEAVSNRLTRERTATHAGAGSHSAVRLFNGFYSLGISDRAVTFVHEFGHAMRAQYGLSAPSRGAELEYNGRRWNIGRWREEMENTGLFQNTPNYWATEQAYRIESVMPRRTAYARMPPEMLLEAESVYEHILRTYRPGNFSINVNNYTLHTNQNQWH